MSKTMYGFSVRVNTCTWSFESTATAPHWPQRHPAGSFPQPSTSSYCRSPASIFIAPTSPVMDDSLPQDWDIGNVQPESKPRP